MCTVSACFAWLKDHFSYLERSGLRIVAEGTTVIEETVKDSKSW
jgi:hypothetical protein